MLIIKNQNDKTIKDYEIKQRMELTSNDMVKIGSSGRCAQQIRYNIKSYSCRLHKYCKCSHP